MGKQHFGNFPYEALSPSIRKNVFYKNIDDVYAELERIFDNAQGGAGSVGEALYLNAGFFVNYDKLVNRHTQVSIKKYIYSKASNTPPYASIDETPVNFIDDFLIIDEEVKYIQASGETEKLAKRKK